MNLVFFPNQLSVTTWLGIRNVEGGVFGGVGADRRPKSVLRLAAAVVGDELPSATREPTDGGLVLVGRYLG
jgi:hypothetical protein